VTELRQKEPRLHDPGFLAFLRTKPCCICGKVGETEAAHIRIGLFAKGMKPHDKYATPLCASHHRSQHGMSEEAFWASHERNPFFIAESLYVEYGGTGGTPRRQQASKKKSQWGKSRKIQSRSFK
jgi:hypothetical protein